MKTPEVNALKPNYNPHTYYENNSEIHKVVDFINKGINGKMFPDVSASIIYHDPYMVLADFADYRQAQQKIEELYKLIASITDPKQIQALFDDLCTRKEVDNMAERIFAARLLMEGKTYNQIMAQSDFSSATLSRVSRCVQYGKGYSKLLKKEE
jgi:TrpR-related protein YerC/YecD